MRITGLPTSLQPLVPARRYLTGAPQSWPCRRYLRDALPGDVLLLVSYDPWRIDSPYRQAAPIFVHESPCEERTVTHLPWQQRRRLLSLRGYDRDGLATVAEVVDGTAAAGRIEETLRDGRTDFVHVHNAAPGCFAVRADRG